MIVDRDFFEHWKTRFVADELGEAAPLGVQRLWAHCEAKKTDTFEMSASVLRSVTRLHGEPEKIEAVLTEARLIERKGATLIVRGWREKNAGLIAAWTNGAKSAGRPPKQPKPNPDISPHIPTGNPPGNPRVVKEPTGNPSETQAKPCSVVLGLEETSTLPLREGANACEIAWNSCQQIFGRKNTVPNYRSATELARQAEACVADAAWPLLIPFYAAAKADALAVERWHPRESADSLAENLAGELDKARQWARETGFSGKKNASRSPLAEPEGAALWMFENYPAEASRFTSFWQWPASIRSEFERTDGMEKP